MRVAMPKRHTQWIAEGDDMRLSLTPPPMGRRFSMDINETVLLQLGARALEAAVEQLGRHVAYEHQHEIHAVVAEVLLDRAWALPIIEEELREAARAMVLSLWSDDEKKNLRDWFDVFAGKLKRTTGEDYAVDRVEETRAERSTRDSSSSVNQPTPAEPEA